MQSNQAIRCRERWVVYSKPSSLSSQLLFSLGIPVAAIQLYFSLYSALPIYDQMSKGE